MQRSIEEKRQAIDRAQQLLLKLSAFKNDLPFSPVILQKIFTQTGDNSASPLEEIAATIERDQGLTAKLLRTANSAFYGLQAQVTNVSRAIAVLGLNEIKSIVVAVGVAAMGKSKKPPEAFDFTAYWGHQLRVGMAAKLLASLTHLESPDDLFTSGLLHDLGKLLIAIHAPADWLAIDAAAREAGLPTHEAEDAHWALEHGVVGSMTLKSWNLPPELTEPVNWHHSPMVAPEYRKQALILCLADALVLSLTDPEAPSSCDWSDVLAKLHLDRDRVLAELHALYAGRDFENFAAGLA
ncbi:MAG: HDOD domain-containing protein [Desulfovibrionaceae bacterium]|nr:HDOD domain-containing protein [Desulfovibrionaceae bacterium]